MRLRHLLAVCFALLFSSGPALAADEAPFDALLERYVVASPDGVNRVRYGAWRSNGADRAALDAYVATLEGERPSRYGRDQAFAYWANLYNAVTLQLILENYPLRSIRDIPNCASIGCPNLQRRAWRAASLDADLDAAARAYVNHSRGVTIDAHGRVQVSNIYRWFASDLGDRPQACSITSAPMRRFLLRRVCRALQASAATPTIGR